MQAISRDKCTPIINIFLDIPHSSDSSVPIDISSAHSQYYSMKSRRLVRMLSAAVYTVIVTVEVILRLVYM